MADACHDVTAAAETVMSKSPLHVCLVAPLPPPVGGIANWTRLVRHLAESRTDVDLDILDIAPRWRAIDDLAVWKRALGGGIQLFRDYFLFLRAIGKRPDVIHLTTSGQFAIVRDLSILGTAWIVGIPTIYHIRFGRVPEIARRYAVQWWLMCRAMRMARAVIAIDPSTAQMIQHRRPALKVLRIPNGVDLGELPVADCPSPLQTVLFLGWVVRTKGVEELVQAWAGMEEVGWCCLIAGPGADGYREELQQRFQPSQLEFLPEQSHEEAMRLMAAADIFVLPSHTEGFPNVLIEAMAMGKAIIASSVGAIPEMLSGECGVSVPPQNTEALGQALRRLMADADLRTVMGDRAQKKAHSEYAMDKVFEQLVVVWRQHSRR